MVPIVLYHICMDVDQGHILLSFLWLEVAKRVVEKAIQIYELTPEQGAALKKVFLRPGDYSVHTL